MKYPYEMLDQAILFALHHHKDQQVPGTELPYAAHLARVAARVGTYFSGDEHIFAQVGGWLHDVVEDTPATLDEVRETFGPDMAIVVDAMSKPKDMDKPQAMQLSLEKLAKAGPVAATLKMSDRMINLGKPPRHWPKEKIAYYHSEARKIHEALSPHGMQAAGDDLQACIVNYEQYL